MSMTSKHDSYNPANPRVKWLHPGQHHHPPLAKRGSTLKSCMRLHLWRIRWTTQTSVRRNKWNRKRDRSTRCSSRAGASRDENQLHWRPWERQSAIWGNQSLNPRSSVECTNSQRMQAGWSAHEGSEDPIGGWDTNKTKVEEETCVQWTKPSRNVSPHDH